MECNAVFEVELAETVAEVLAGVFHCDVSDLAWGVPVNMRDVVLDVGCSLVFVFGEVD